MQCVEQVIQTNAYFAHPENILIAMLHDRRIEVRRLALNHIKESRLSKCQNLRKFEIPCLIYSANEYFNMIDWRKCKITEPPMTMNMPLEELKDFVEEYHEGDEPLFRFPAHTQAVERTVKLVTETPIQVCDDKAKDERIRTVILRRKQQLSLETKSDYI